MRAVVLEQGAGRKLPRRSRLSASGLPAARRGSHRRRPERPPVEVLVLAEDGRLEAAQSGARLDPQLLAQRAGEILVGPQRFGLAAGPPVERQHPVTPDSLSQRVSRHERRQLPDEPAVAAATGLVGVDAVLERAQRASSSRAASARANGMSATSARAGPRHSASASPRAIAASSASPAAGTRRPLATSASNAR